MRRCFDWDDYEDSNHDWLLKRLEWLREINPDFRCTLFGIPYYSTHVDDLPNWVEVVPHGWQHPTPIECAEWDNASMSALIYWQEHLTSPRWTEGFKAPGWQISDGSYEALRDARWWVADQEYNRPRRPLGLQVYEIGPNDWHGHVQNVCGNGLEETWSQVVELVRDTERFDFCSERALAWVPSPS